MNTRIVFFDIDGTLKPYRRPVPTSAKEAIRLLRANGHIPVVCTGRTRAAAVSNDWMEELDFAGMICAGGGQVLYQGESIFLQTLPPRQAARLEEILLDAGCVFVLEGPEGLFYAPVQEQEARRVCEPVFGSRVPLRPAATERWAVQKAIVLYGGGLTEKGYLPELEEQYQLLWYHTAEGLVELLPRGVSKATGIQALLTHLGLTAADTVAFGDGPNDVEMLAYCHTGVAMGDGQDCAKAAADYITGPCDGSGIYDACRSLGLI